MAVRRRKKMSEPLLQAFLEFQAVPHLPTHPERLECNEGKYVENDQTDVTRSANLWA